MRYRIGLDCQPISRFNNLFSNLNENFVYLALSICTIDKINLQHGLRK